jgi:TRAP-type C4-dicarboxylate transport system permease large subunit
MPIILKVGIDPVHFGLVLTLNPDDRAVASTARHGVVRLGAKISDLSIERTTMAILPWLIPLLASLVAITLIPSSPCGYRV